MSPSEQPPEHDAPFVGGQSAIQTSLAVINEFTGGMLPGAVWLVTGQAAVGRSMFALKLAVDAANQGVPTVSVCLRDDPRDVSARVVAQLGRVPVHYVLTGAGKNPGDPLWAADEQRRIAAEARLKELPLSVVGGHHVQRVDGVRDVIKRASPRARVAVVDDLSLLGSDGSLSTRIAPLLPAVRARLTARGRTLVVTDRCVDGDAFAHALPRDSWDVHIHLERADMLERESPRAGEIDLYITRARDGSKASTTLCMQGHYARFLELPDDWENAERAREYRTSAHPSASR